MNATPAWRPRLWLATALVLTGYKLWLTRGQGLYAIGATPQDDRLYVELAHHLVHGSWLGNYNELTLAHGPFYPLFIAAAFGIGLPLALAQQALYTAACAWFTRALRPAVTSAGARCAIYLLLLWNPMTFDAATMGRVLRQHVYVPLGLMIVAGLVALYLRRDRPARQQAAWAGLLGLASGAFYLTREDGLWFVPAVLVLGGASLLGAWRISRATFQRTAGLLGLAAAVAALPVLLVCVENKRNYGWFGTSELRGASFAAAYATMQRVRAGTDLPDVPVTRAAREAMAQASPRFAELQKQFEAVADPGWAGSAELLTRRPVAADETGGGVMPWALRRAVGRAGYHHDAGQAHYYYKHLTRELDQAIDAGRLSVGPRQLEAAGSTAGRALGFADFVISFSRFSARPPPSTGTPDELNLFRDLTNERLSPPAGELDVVGAAEYLQNVARVDRLQVIGKALRPLLLALTILALVVGAVRALLAAWQRRWTYPLTLAAAVALAIGAALLQYATLEVHAYPVLSIATFAPLYPLLLVFISAILWDAVAAWRARTISTGNEAGSVSV